ncbi:MAG: hypothetical protein QM752_00420 [Gammaproteobacteria bacterium]
MAINSPSNNPCPYDGLKQILNQLLTKNIIDQRLYDNLQQFHSKNPQQYFDTLNQLLVDFKAALKKHTSQQIGLALGSTLIAIGASTLCIKMNVNIGPITDWWLAIIFLSISTAFSLTCGKRIKNEMASGKPELIEEFEAAINRLPQSDPNLIITRQAD